MGVLEDAIREHLELKRKHGASEEELERKEEEALGPARREFEASAEETSEGKPEAAAEPEEEEAPEHDAPPASPTQETEPSPSEDEPSAGEPTMSEAPDELAQKPDELEEERDFAEETPEEDRLWSERKPPRDFDFD